MFWTVIVIITYISVVLYMSVQGCTDIYSCSNKFELTWPAKMPIIIGKYPIWSFQLPVRVKWTRFTTLHVTVHDNCGRLLHWPILYYNGSKACSSRPLLNTINLTTKRLTDWSIKPQSWYLVEDRQAEEIIVSFDLIWIAPEGFITIVANEGLEKARLVFLKVLICSCLRNTGLSVEREIN